MKDNSRTHERSTYTVYMLRFRIRPIRMYLNIYGTDLCLSESAKTPVLPRSIESKRQVDTFKQVEPVGRLASVAASAGITGGTGRARATRPRFRGLRAQLSPNHIPSVHYSTHARKLPTHRRYRRRRCRWSRNHLTNSKQVLRRS